MYRYVTKFVLVLLVSVKANAADTTPTTTTTSPAASVRPFNHTLLLEGKEHPCNETVYVRANVSRSILKCSVDSNPQGQFTWTSAAYVFGRLTGITTCVLRNATVYHCTNTLMLPNLFIPVRGVKVNCHIDAAGYITNICVRIGKERTTTMERKMESTSTVKATPAGIKSTASTAPATEIIAEAKMSGSTKRLRSWSVAMLLVIAYGSLLPPPLAI